MAEIDLYLPLKITVWFILYKYSSTINQAEVINAGIIYMALSFTHIFLS